MVALALIGLPTSRWWDWGPRISRGACKLAGHLGYQKKEVKVHIVPGTFIFV